MIGLCVVRMPYKNGNEPLQIQLVFRSQDSMEITPPPADRLEAYFRHVIVDPACTPPITFNGNLLFFKSLKIVIFCICLKKLDLCFIFFLLNYNSGSSNF